MSWIPPTIAKDNDLTFEIGPIRGRNPTTNAIEDWTGTTVTAWITIDPISDTPLGGVSAVASVSAAAATFVVSFQASEVNAVLAATSLTEGMTFYAVCRGTGDFRRVIPLVYHTYLAVP